MAARPRPVRPRGRPVDRRQAPIIPRGAWLIAAERSLNGGGRPLNGIEAAFGYLKTRVQVHPKETPSPPEVPVQPGEFAVDLLNERRDGTRRRPSPRSKPGGRGSRAPFYM